MITSTTGSNMNLLMSIVKQPPAFAGGGFGLNWALAAQVVGWVVSGVGLGKQVYDEWQAREEVEKIKEAVPAGQLTAEDIPTMAAGLSKAYPAVSTDTWQRVLTETLGNKIAGVQPPTARCPEGTYLDPATGECKLIKAGFEMPPWGWGVAAVVGFLVLSQMGVLKGIGVSGLWGTGCRDKEGKFVPVPQCRNRRRKKK